MWAIKETIGKTEEIFFQSQPNQDPPLDLILINAPANKTTKILVGGAVASGKSKLMAAGIILFSEKYPGSRIIVGRKDSNDLKTSLYLDILNMLPRSLIVAPENVKTNLSMAPLVLLTNKSRIGFAEMKELGASGKFGIEANMVVLDEISEIAETLAHTMETRLRAWIGAPQNTPFILMGASNPTPGWVKKTFVMNARLPAKEKDPNTHFFPLYPKDNVSLNNTMPNFISDMRKRFPESWVKRYLDGDWDISVEGAIYTEFDQKIHVVNDFVIPAEWKLWHGLDPALGKPHKGLYAAQVPNGGPTFFYRSITGLPGETSRDFLQRMLALEKTDNLLATTRNQKNHDIHNVTDIHKGQDPYERLIDYSLAGNLHDKNEGYSLWQILDETGVKYYNAKKISVWESIMLVKDGLAPKGGTAPFLYVFKSNTDLIEEFTNYKINPNEEGRDFRYKPIKYQDDLLDLVRYIWIEEPWKSNPAKRNKVSGSPYITPSAGEAKLIDPAKERNRNNGAIRYFR